VSISSNSSSVFVNEMVTYDQNNTRSMLLNGLWLW